MRKEGGLWKEQRSTHTLGLDVILDGKGYTVQWTDKLARLGKFRI
jgi:hypothetical protein